MSTNRLRSNVPLRISLLALILVLLAGASAGCSGTSGAAAAGNNSQVPAGLKMAPMQDMPAEVQTAPVSVRQAYQFAAANPDVLQHIPCYCGCGAMGHTSNYACYISGQDSDGKLAFDQHALGCSICVDITQDSMRLLKQGKSLPDIKLFVDGKYAQYGPSNMP